jgi:hypothetical protein
MYLNKDYIIMVFIVVAAGIGGFAFSEILAGNHQWFIYQCLIYFVMFGIVFFCGRGNLNV